jgi:hypothetical protein
VVIFHSLVTGAAGYVVESAAGERVPCSDESAFCTAVFAKGAPGCGTTLRAVDADGRVGVPSTSFCVHRPDAASATPSATTRSATRRADGR